MVDTSVIREFYNLLKKLTPKQREQVLGIMIGMQLSREVKEKERLEQKDRE